MSPFSNSSEYKVKIVSIKAKLFIWHYLNILFLADSSRISTEPNNYWFLLFNKQLTANFFTIASAPTNCCPSKVSIDSAVLKIMDQISHCETNAFFSYKTLSVPSKSLHPLVALLCEEEILIIHPWSQLKAGGGRWGSSCYGFILTSVSSLSPFSLIYDQGLHG